MSAYVIVDSDVHDVEAYKEYIHLAPATVSAFGGSYFARGGVNKTIEGDWKAKHLVILEIPSMEQTRKWLNSAEYAPIRAL